MTASDTEQPAQVYEQKIILGNCSRTEDQKSRIGAGLARIFGAFAAITFTVEIEADVATIRIKRTTQEGGRRIEHDEELHQGRKGYTRSCAAKGVELNITEITLSLVTICLRTIAAPDEAVR